MNWQQLLRIALVLLSLNFSAENFGYLTHQLYQFLGMLCVIFYGLTIFPFDKKTERRVYFFSGCLLLILALSFFTGSVLYRLAGTGIFLLSLGLLLKSKGEEEREIPLLLFTVTVYYFFFLHFTAFD